MCTRQTASDGAGASTPSSENWMIGPGLGRTDPIKGMLNGNAFSAEGTLRVLSGRALG